MFSNRSPGHRFYGNHSPVSVYQCLKYLGLRSILVLFEQVKVDEDEVLVMVESFLDSQAILSYNTNRIWNLKGDIMQVVNFTEARNNLKSLFDTVYNDSEEIIVNRKHGENVVIISLDTYNAMKETDYLLSSPKNRARLLHSLENARAGNVKERELEE